MQIKKLTMHKPLGASLGNPMQQHQHQILAGAARSIHPLPLPRASVSFRGSMRSCCSATSSNQDLLQDCLSMDDTGLRDYVTSSKDALSMDFMMWLKAREEEAQNAEKSKLNVLCGKLTALREGTGSNADPLAAAQLREAVQEHGGSDALKDIQVPSTSGEEVQLHVEQRRAELARRQALDAVSATQLATEQDKAFTFAEELQKRKAASTAEMIGRAPVEMRAAERGLNAAAAADRILEALLSIEDTQERLAMVPEAFIPPPAAASQDENLEEELLHTSPMRLLQAVSLAMRRLEGRSTDQTEDFLMPSSRSTSMPPEKQKHALLGIKQAIFNVLEDES